MKIRKSDEVMVILGKDRGKKGKVQRNIPDKNRIIVEGINMTKRHMKPKGTMRQAGIIEREGPIHISDVMLVCSKCGKPTRIGYRYLDDKKKVRICKKCHEVID